MAKPKDMFSAIRDMPDSDLNGAPNKKKYSDSGVNIDEYISNSLYRKRRPTDNSLLHSLTKSITTSTKQSYEEFFHEFDTNLFGRLTAKFNANLRRLELLQSRQIRDPNYIANTFKDARIKERIGDVLDPKPKGFLKRFLGPRSPDNETVLDKKLTWEEMVIASLEANRLAAKRFYNRAVKEKETPPDKKMSKKMMGTLFGPAIFKALAGTEIGQALGMGSFLEGGMLNAGAHNVASKIGGGSIFQGLAAALGSPLTPALGGAMMLKNMLANSRNKYNAKANDLDIGKTNRVVTNTTGGKDSFLKKLTRVDKIDPDKPIISGHLTIDEMKLSIADSTRLELRRHHKHMEAAVGKKQELTKTMTGISKFFTFFGGTGNKDNIFQRIRDIATLAGPRKYAREHNIVAQVIRGYDQYRFNKDPNMKAKMDLINKKTTAAVFDKETHSSINTKVPNILKYIGENVAGIFEMMKIGGGGGKGKQQKLEAAIMESKKLAEERYSLLESNINKNYSDESRQDQLYNKYMEHAKKKRDIAFKRGISSAAESIKSASKSAKEHSKSLFDQMRYSSPMMGLQNFGRKGLSGLASMGRGANSMMHRMLGGPAAWFSNMMNMSNEGKANTGYGPISRMLSNMSRFIPKFAKGGILGGKGTGTSDSNIAAFSKGEMLINAKATRENARELHAINAGKKPKYVKTLKQKKRYDGGNKDTVEVTENTFGRIAEDGTISLETTRFQPIGLGGGKGKGGLLDTLKDWLLPVASFFAKGGIAMALLTALKEQPMVKAVLEAAGKGVNVVKSAVGKTLDVAKAIGNKGLEQASKVWNATKTAAGSAIEFGKDVAGKGVNIVKSGLGKAGELGAKGIQFAKGGLAKAGEFGAKALSTGKDLIKSGASKTMQFGKDAFNATKGKAIQGLNAAKGFIAPIAAKTGLTTAIKVGGQIAGKLNVPLAVALAAKDVYDIQDAGRGLSKANEAFAKVQAESYEKSSQLRDKHFKDSRDFGSFKSSVFMGTKNPIEFAKGLLSTVKNQSDFNRLILRMHAVTDDPRARELELSKRADGLWNGLTHETTAEFMRLIPINKATQTMMDYLHAHKNEAIKNASGTIDIGNTANPNISAQGTINPSGMESGEVDKVIIGSSQTQAKARAAAEAVQHDKMEKINSGVKELNNTMVKNTKITSSKTGDVNNTTLNVHPSNKMIPNLS